MYGDIWPGHKALAVFVDKAIGRIGGSAVAATGEREILRVVDRHVAEP